MFNFNNIFSSNATNTGEVIDQSGRVLCTYHFDNMFEMEEAIQVLKEAYPCQNWAIRKTIANLEARIQKIKDEAKPQVDTKAAEIARLQKLATQYTQAGMAPQAKAVKAKLEKLKKAEAKKDKEETPSLKGQLWSEVKQQATPEVAAPQVSNHTEFAAAFLLLQKNHRGYCWVDMGGTICVYEPKLGLKPNKVHKMEHLSINEQMALAEAEEITAYIYKK
jgi:hypothetical protein